MKSYNKIILDKTDTRENYIENLDLRFYNKDVSNLIFQEINNSKISVKSYDELYILTDLNFKIHPELVDKYKIKKLSSLENFKPDEIKGSFFFILFSSDDLAIPHLKKIIEKKGFFKSLGIDENQLNSDFSNATSYRFTNSNCMKAIQSTFNKKINISGSFLSTLKTHENICEGIELTKNVEGEYIEIGVFEGGSALTALNYFKQIGLKRNVFLLDTFEGFNYEESKNSSDIVWHKSHFISKEEQTKKFLKKTFQEFNNYKLVTSNICKDDLPQEIDKISLAHVDVDLYEATLQSLKKVSKKVSKNGIIMCEDPVYTPFLYGALYAMEEFLKSSEGKSFTKIFKKNHYFLINNK